MILSELLYFTVPQLLQIESKFNKLLLNHFSEVIYKLLITVPGIKEMYISGDFYLGTKMGGVSHLNCIPRCLQSIGLGLVLNNAEKL